MKKFFPVFILLIILCFAGVEAQDTPERWAFIVGIGEYSETARLEPLPYAMTDVEAVKKMFMESWAVPEGNIITLLNQEATMDKIKETITKDLAEKVDENDTIFIYYNGYGQYNFPDFNGDETGGSDECIVPYDCEANFPKTYITDDKFTKWIEKIKGNIVMIMEFDGGYGMADFAGNSSLEDRTIVMSVYNLPGEVALGDPGLRQSVMTYYLLQVNRELYEDYTGDDELGNLTLQEILDKMSEEIDEYLENKGGGQFAVTGKLDTKSLIILNK